ncbi:hypothetical protein Hanom_Chr03g00268241 [Helianthus anomalus]
MTQTNSITPKKPKTLMRFEPILPVHEDVSVMTKWFFAKETGIQEMRLLFFKSTM